MLFGDDGGLTGIVDWELSTIGDPMMDLGHLLVTWPQSNRPPFAGLLTPRATGGFPSPDDLAARFAERTRWSLEHLPWYRVLAAYRLGVIIEGTYVRAMQGLAPQAVGRLLHDSAVELWTDALSTVSES